MKRHGVRRRPFRCNFHNCSDSRTGRLTMRSIGSAVLWHSLRRRSRHSRLPAQWSRRAISEPHCHHRTTSPKAPLLPLPPLLPPARILPSAFGLRQLLPSIILQSPQANETLSLLVGALGAAPGTLPLRVLNISWSDATAAAPLVALLERALSLRMCRGIRTPNATLAFPSAQMCRPPY